MMRNVPRYSTTLKLAQPHDSGLLDIPTTFSRHLDSASWAPMQSQAEAKVPWCKRRWMWEYDATWWNMMEYDGICKCPMVTPIRVETKGTLTIEHSQPIFLWLCCFSRKVCMQMKERTRNKSVLKTGFGLFGSYLSCLPKPVKIWRRWPCYGLSSSFLMCCTDTDQTEVQLLCAQSSRGWVDSQ